MPPSEKMPTLAAEPGAPAVCRAGYMQFSGDRSFTNPCVQSRGFFWCKSGTGRFRVNGEEYSLNAQDLYVLPWNRTIEYLPDKADPMYTGHVHVVPFYRTGSPWVPNVPHYSGDDGFDSPDRSDMPWPNVKDVAHFRIAAGDPIALLMDYIIRSYLRGKGADEAEARHWGCLLISELIRLGSLENQQRHNFPEELLRMVAHVESSYMRSVTVSELAHMIGRSRSHVLKLFRNHLGVSAKTYIIDRQLKQACELLLSTTRSIAEVGQAVGIPDPYHFSKLFRRHRRVSPSAYRLNHGPINLPGSIGLAKAPPE